MNSQEYVKNVLVLESRDVTVLSGRFSAEKSIRLLHAVMGLTSELAEIQELVEKPTIDSINLKEESGDLFWYMGVMIDELKFDPDHIFMFNDTGAIVTYTVHEQRLGLQTQINGMVKTVGTITDFLKKHLMYGKELNIKEIQEKLQALDYYINLGLRHFGLTSQSARERNIEKLKARYGDKFSESAALERNLEKERSILEK